MEKVVEILETVNDDHEFFGDEDSLPKASEIEAIVLFSPNNGNATDEDTDNKDDRNLNHLTPAQLTSEVEVIHKDSAHAHNSDELHSKPNTSAHKKKQTRHWESTQTFFRIATTPCEDDDSETGDMYMVNTRSRGGAG